MNIIFFFSFMLGYLSFGMVENMKMIGTDVDGVEQWCVWRVWGGGSSIAPCSDTHICQQ